MKKLTLILTLLLASCVGEREIEQPIVCPADGMAEVQVQASMPATTVVTTRGEVGTVLENKIENIFVLVFKTTGEMVYKGLGRDVAQSGTNGNIVKFKATLPIGTAYDFMVLANTGTLLNSVNVGAGGVTKATVQALVRENTLGRWQHFTAIPMWDEQQLTLQAEGTASFNLMRMLARINVDYSPATGTDNYFHMERVRLYNYNTRAALVPADANITGTGATRRVDKPTLPANAGTQEELFVEYFHSADISNFNSCRNRIYAMEAATRGKYTDGDAKWVLNPCLLIGGRYDSDKDGDYVEEPITWYRVDMIKKGTGDYLSLLRNFTYNVAITSVSGAGYYDPDIALKSAPVNIKSDVINWNDGEMDQVIFEGTAYLSVNKHELILRRTATDVRLPDGSNTLDIKTDYAVNGFPDRSGWHAEYYTDEAGTQKMTNPWLKLRNGALTDKGPVTGTPDDPAAQTFFDFEANNSGANRTAYVFITAGRLRYRVKVTQKLLSLQLFEVVGTNNTEIHCDSMLFIIPHDRNQRHHAGRKIIVKWEPTDKSVTMQMRSPLVFNPFTRDWVMDDLTGNPVLCPNEGDWTFTSQFAEFPGSYRFVIKPPEIDAPVDQGILDKDPFFDKESVYSFKLTNDGDTESVSIRLKHIFYNLIVDTHKYRLDGATHTLTARSNTEWKITKIEEYLYNQPPTPSQTSPVMLNLKDYDNLRVGTTGGPNVNGEALAFTVVNNDSGVHKNKWGTVYVTFESPEKKFPAHTVAIPFPPATKLLLGIGYHDAAYATNVGIATHYHHNSAFQMLTSPYNFGSMEESTHKVEGFRVIGYNAEGVSNGNPNGLHPDRDWHKFSMCNWLNEDQPDVIVLSSYTTDTYGTQYNDNEIRLLKEFVNNGGALIMMANGLVTHEDNLANMLEAMLDKPKGTFTTGTGGNNLDKDVKNWIDTPATGAYYDLKNVDDPILNGLFGDIRGKLWGAHYHTGGIKTSLISGVAVPLSDGKAEDPAGRGNTGYTTIFRHKTKNFLFVGCDGFPASNMTKWQLGTYPQYGPVSLDQRFYRPIPRTNWGSSQSQTVTVYNSILLANAVSWALNVSNHMPPVGGYQNQ